PVERIVVDGRRAVGVQVAGEDVSADAVLFTGSLPALSPLVPDEHRDARWAEIGGLGVLCVILELRRPLTGVYWTNVCDAEMPFGGIIEHTNLVPAADYGGRHVVYLSRYFTADEPVARGDPTDEARRWIEA